MNTKLSLILAIALTAIHNQAANAVLQVTAESDIAPPGGAVHDPFQPTFSGGSVSSVDILQGLLPITSTGDFTLEFSTGLSALTDGSDATVYPESGTGGDAIDHAAYATVGLNNGGTEVTYAFGGVFDLSEVVVYGGWNDGGRDAQKYDLFTSDDGVNFTLLASHDGGNGESGTEPIGWRVEFSDSLDADIAAAVTHLRLTFPSVENNYTGISEIDVIGTPLTVLGDANGDGLVNTADFVVISDNFLTTPSAFGEDGDIDFSGFVDEADFRLWKNIEPKDPDQLSGVEAVPEPTALMLAAAGLLMVGRRR